jgi:hypothetical protein
MPRGDQLARGAKGDVLDLLIFSPFSIDLLALQYLWRTCFRYGGNLASGFQGFGDEFIASGLSVEGAITGFGPANA